jgi:hypothetical protein
MVNSIASIIAIVLGIVSFVGIADAPELKLKVLTGETVNIDSAKHDGLINVDFPEPTDILDIARAFTLWTGVDYVVDDRVDAKVRLISPERVTTEEALKRFQQMLNANQLRAIQTDSGFEIKAN